MRRCVKSPLSKYSYSHSHNARTCQYGNESAAEQTYSHNRQPTLNATSLLPQLTQILPNIVCSNNDLMSRLWKELVCCHCPWCHAFGHQNFPYTITYGISICNSITANMTTNKSIAECSITKQRRHVWVVPHTVLQHKTSRCIIITKIFPNYSSDNENNLLFTCTECSQLGLIAMSWNDLSRIIMGNLIFH